MFKFHAIFGLLLFLMVSNVQATVVIPTGVENQWIANGQLNVDDQVAVFQVTTDDVLGYQLFANITPIDDADTVLALYDMDNNFIAYNDDYGDSYNPTLFTLLPLNETYILKLGLFSAFDFGSYEFIEYDIVDFPIDNYDFTLSFVNASPVVVHTPVPAAIWLLGSGIAGLIGFRRKRKK